MKMTDEDRIVVTGMGLISPAGNDVKENWDNIINSKSCINKITNFDVTNTKSKIAGCIKPSRSINDNISDLAKKLEVESKYGLDSKLVKSFDYFTLYGMIAAIQAIEDSKCISDGIVPKDRIGITVGSGIGGLPIIESSAFTLKTRGPKRISPYFIPSALINLISGQISIKYGITGPSDSCVTACATSCHSIINAIRIIKQKEADVVIAGGTEGAVCELGIGGFDAMRALSTNYNESPSKASRPWDKKRDGFVMAEGAGILVIESYASAKKRNAKIYTEISGYGCSADANHYTAPRSDALGAINAINKALRMANISPEKIGYINAHGTSTPLGDEAEIKASKHIFQNNINNVAISSIKSSIGHALGAAGGIETILTIMSLNNSMLPPTLNLDEPEDFCTGINLVPHVAQEKRYDYALKNSFGFGGMNASLILKKIV